MSSLTVNEQQVCPHVHLMKDGRNKQVVQKINISTFFLSASLSGLLHLHELDLSDNKLSFVQYGVLEDLYFLSQLKLGGNPWVCDYK